jgi:hypothetical protein
MNKAQRKDWRRYVFGCAELTPAHRLVLLALEGFADYPEGTNARPGVTKLAEICALKPRAVEYALALGRDLDLIRQTGRANPVRKLAAVYRLIPAPVSTRTTVHVETDSIRTGMRVDAPNNDNFNPQEPAFLPARNDISTRTSVQPTNPLTPSHYTEREKTAADCVDAAPAPMSSQEEEQQADDDPEPPLFCPQHPYGTVNGKAPKCGSCGTHRIANEAWHKRHPEADAPPALVSTLNPGCRICGGFGDVLGDDGTPLEPAIKCPECRPLKASAQAVSA